MYGVEEVGLGEGYKAKGIIWGLVSFLNAMIMSFIMYHKNK
jgi:hypothetical protein